MLTTPTSQGFTPTMESHHSHCLSSVAPWGTESSSLPGTLALALRQALASAWHVDVAEGKRTCQSTKWLNGLCLEVTHYFLPLSLAKTANVAKTRLNEALKFSSPNPAPREKKWLSLHLRTALVHHPQG